MLSLSLAALVLACHGDPSPDAGDSLAQDSPLAPDSGPLNGDGLDLDLVFREAPAEEAETAASWFVFGASDAAGYRCALDDAAPTPCEPELFFVVEESGEHQLTVWAEGPDGSLGEPATHRWQLSSLLTAAHPEMVATEVTPSAVDEAGWRGIFRINCDFAHSSYDDPIVYPGSPGAAHLHRFYGNLETDADTTWSSLFEAPASSCQGNTVNASAYWVPALLAPSFDELSGERLLDAHGAPAWEVVPAVVGDNEVAHEVFYYSAGIDDLEAIQSVPPGLRMIAGVGSTAPEVPAQDTAVVRWHCQSWESNDGDNPRFSASIPECAEPDRVRMDVFFPSCWDGVNLDSEDHMSHMAYPVQDGGPNSTRCPESHPVPILRPSYHYAYPVLPGNSDPASATSRGWRLASDGYEVTETQPGGLSLHGDWFNAWEPEVLQAVLDNCVRAELDCHDGNLANGLRLSGTTPGSQEEPEILNEGMGEHGGHGG